MSFHEDWCDIFNTEKRCTCGSVHPRRDDPNPEHTPSARELNEHPHPVTRRELRRIVNRARAEELRDYADAVHDAYRTGETIPAGVFIHAAYSRAREIES